MHSLKHTHTTKYSKQPNMTNTIKAQISIVTDFLCEQFGKATLVLNIIIVIIIRPAIKIFVEEIFGHV